jgi:Predicted membrane protein
MKNIFSRAYWGEKDVEQYIGKLLRYGVMLACTITTFGGIVYIIQRNGIMPDYKSIPSGQPFPGVEQYLRELNTILPRVMEFDGAAIIQLGVVVLIATPILRVAFSAISFLIEKDYMYVVITLIVLSIILANMILGLH